MILLISDEYCESTNIVIDWLNYYRQNYTRINSTDICTLKHIKITSNNIKIKLIVNGQLIDLSKIRVVWYRTGDINLYKNLNVFSSKDFNKLDTQIIKHLNGELQELTSFIYQQLCTKNKIGTPGYHHCNKLRTLEIASNFGLLIPNSYVICSKDDFPNIKSTITKSIRNIPVLKWKRYTSKSVTCRVHRKHVNRAKNFFPSLIQEEIIKDFEIRIFYLCGIFKAMAIFSQSSRYTEVDFRNYDPKSTTREVPYKLPLRIQNKLKKMLQFMKLSSASIDMIKTISNQYVFLEINPVGQFGMVSLPCNYYLEKEIAMELIKLNK